jgi:hypothetical protein
VAKARAAVKTVDDEIVLKKPRKGARLREEVWQASDGEVVKYSLAYINPRVCGTDNGRVLGYDNSHDRHHRHFMGTVEPVRFEGYRVLAARFRKEVLELWRKEDEQRQSE